MDWSWVIRAPGFEVGVSSLVPHVFLCGCTFLSGARELGFDTSFQMVGTGRGKISLPGDLDLSNKPHEGW